ncbi:MAG: hypothetical protein P8171_19945, partial [Candidatus Thiodiazotropha sp.]
GAEGQRIYQITRANMDTALPNIHHDGKGEIEAALQAGMNVITHTDSVSVPGWSGGGYIILDPEDNAGAYKISGGVDGGYLIILGFMMIAAMMIIVAFAFIAGPIGWMAAAMFVGSELLLFFQALEFGSLILDVANSDCSSDEKYRIIKQAIFLLTIELILSIFFRVKIENASEVWREETYEILEVIGIGGSFGVLSELAEELNTPDVICQ